MTAILSIAMTRGGTLPMRVIGRAYRDGDVDIDSVQWLRGGEVDERHIQDRQQVIDAFLAWATNKEI
jgi:hypothetical protein